MQIVHVSRRPVAGNLVFREASGERRPPSERTCDMRPTMRTRKKRFTLARTEELPAIRAAGAMRTDTA
jgi:hypothetical protein